MLNNIITTMEVDYQNRYRVSTNFTMLKIGICIIFLSVIVNIIRDIRNDSFDQKSITGLTLQTLAIIGIIYFLGTTKRIDYDDIKQILYIVDTKKNIEIEIPVERIDKILYSAIGGRRNKSYVIIYRDFHGQKQKARLYPILFDNSIDTIITDTKLKNPELVTKKWSFG